MLKRCIGGVVIIGWIAFSGAGTQPAHAGQSLKNDLQNWDMVTLTVPVSPNKKVLLYTEAQVRVGNLQEDGGKNDFSQLLLRPALGYRLNRHVSVWQGYAWTPIFASKNRNENRIFQQLLVEGRLARLRWGSRTRLEERWIENTNSETAVRLRTLLKGVYPLGKSEKWFLSAFDEFFVNLRGVPNGPQAGIDQNRAFIGLQRSLGKRASLEAGYMNQYVKTREPVPDRMNHIILINLNFDCR